MITLRRSMERHRDRRRKGEAWRTFRTRDRADPLADGFGSLEELYEDRVPPGGGIPDRPAHEAEIVTYVREGAIAYDDSTGRSGIIAAGEFQRMAAGRGVSYSEANCSRTEWAHVFRLVLRPREPGPRTGREQRRFSVAERRDGPCVVASPDARKGSLRLLQDALVYSAILELGQHVVHELVRERSAWLHLVEGELALGDIFMTTGDGMGVTAERALSLTARQESEILLLDLR